MSCNVFGAVVRVITDVETKEIKGQQLSKCRCVHDTSFRDNSALYMGLNFWGNKAAAAEKIIKNGSSIFVRGNLSVTTTDAGKVYHDLNVDDFHVVSRGENGKPDAAPEKKKGTKVTAPDIDVNVDLPF